MTNWSPESTNSTNYQNQQTTKTWDSGTWDGVGYTASDANYYWDGLLPSQFTTSPTWTPESINSTNWS